MVTFKSISTECSKNYMPKEISRNHMPKRNKLLKMGKTLIFLNISRYTRELTEKFMKSSFVTFCIVVESPGINNTTYLAIFMCTFRENSKVTK